MNPFRKALLVVLALVLIPPFALQATRYVKYVKDSRNETREREEIDKEVMKTFFLFLKEADKLTPGELRSETIHGIIRITSDITARWDPKEKKICGYTVSAKLERKEVLRATARGSVAVVETTSGERSLTYDIQVSKDNVPPSSLR